MVLIIVKIVYGILMNRIDFQTDFIKRRQKMYYSRYLKADKDYVKSLKLYKNNFKDFHNFKHHKTNQTECFIIYNEKTSNRHYYYFSNLA